MPLLQNHIAIDVVKAAMDRLALASRTGGTFKVSQLGLDYGFNDIDGTRPEPFQIREQDA